MARPRTQARQSSPAAERVHAPSVLVVLVARDGAPWLRQCLMALSRQTHPRLGLIAVDNASTDGSGDLLESVLGAERVMRLTRNVGFAGAVSQALGGTAARDSDFVLLLHDDTLLAPDAIERLVEAAERIDGVGVVGPKVVDWDEPRKLLEIGLSSDRFGYPYSPLEEGEIDQGQYDRVREVLFVSCAAMLIARDAWGRVGSLDERFAAHQDDLDFCWRARLAGFRVLMTPRALVRHREASRHGRRSGASPVGRERYERERVALASILKNYGVLSLLWILPLYLVQGMVRAVALLLSRRFEDAYQVLAAWGWNAAHLPGTLRRRVRAQAVRVAPDRAVRRSMAPAGFRLRRWGQMAGRTLVVSYRGVEEEAEEVPQAARIRLGRFAMDHPVALAWIVGGFVAAVAYRHLAGAPTLLGGGSVRFPASASDFFRELASGLRHTGLGGTQPASPALGILGAGSVLTLGRPALLERALLLGLPLAAAAGCYRVVRSLTGERAPSAVAGAAYALSSAVMWSVSEGRIAVLVFLAGLPWLASKLAEVFGQDLRVGRVRWIVGTGLGLAVLGSFFPGSFLAAAVLTVAFFAVPEARARRVRGLAGIGTATAVAAVLALPVTWGIVSSHGASLADTGGEPSFSALARLSLGPGPGSWTVAWFLPLAAALALLFVSRRFARAAVAATVAAVASLYLAWFAAAGYLPRALANPVAYVGVAAFSYVLLIGAGLASVLRGVERHAFGPRQVGVAFMTLTLGFGLTLQALQAMKGSWTVGGADRLPPAYPVVGAVGGPPYRVLWLGAGDGDAFAAPGGLPDGAVVSGRLSVRFAVGGPAGASALDVGRPDDGPGYDALRRALAEVLGGQTRHGGALLGPMGIRFIVAAPGDVPGGVLRRLSRQLDLDLIPAGGLVVFRNAQWVSLASTVETPAWLKGAFSSAPEDLASLPLPQASPLGAAGTAFRGPARPAPSLVLLSQQFDGRWELEPTGSGETVGPKRAFGWAVGFTAPAGRGYEVRFGGQGMRTVGVAVIGFLWLAAAWMTRRPARPIGRRGLVSR